MKQYKNYMTELVAKGFREVWKPGLYKYFQGGTIVQGAADDQSNPVVVWKVGILKSQLAEHGGTLTLTASSSLFTMSP
jgi:hypothetical protein